MRPRICRKRLPVKPSYPFTSRVVDISTLSAPSRPHTRAPVPRPSRPQPRTLQPAGAAGTAIGRAGLFRSKDQGEHWVSARLEALNAKGQTYCRDIREAPGDPKTIWVAAGANFQSDLGALFRTTDGGASWARVDMGVEPKTTMFAIAFDERQPSRMYCASSGGEVFASEDGGRSWAERRLPEGATQVYAMACA
jgi:photosystem II stability/assembly factor-like uncharacterized protein